MVCVKFPFLTEIQSFKAHWRFIRVILRFYTSFLMCFIVVLGARAHLLQYQRVAKLLSCRRSVHSVFILASSSTRHVQTRPGGRLHTSRPTPGPPGGSVRPQHGGPVTSNRPATPYPSMTDGLLSPGWHQEDLTRPDRLAPQLHIWGP